ncbi:MAG: L,D-transpeptidase, partial [Verrucomicrobiaceae bacterium]|nr:L,D-transpeptidase [Verrucomicrobiaceae bacterium]
MQSLARYSMLAALPAAFFLTSCGTPTAGTGSSANYRVVAYKPKDPSNVKVKLSTSTQNIYVMEGDRLLMAVQGTVGANNTTPKGHFRITNKIKNKRRISQPDAGYPMAYWCE